MLKEELRIHYKELRRNLTVRDLEDFSLKISNRLLPLPIWDFTYYHIFLSIPGKKEVDTQFILPLLQGRDKNVVVPKMVSSSRFNSILLTDSSLLKLNSWNIPEPEDGLEVPASKMDVVFIPLLAFDLAGHRVGYGKGFYDSFLRECRQEVVKIGLSFFGPAPEIKDVHDNDRKMDFCVTPEQTYTF